MRIIEILWLLTACLGMSVLSQVGNDSLSPECNCSAENFSEFFYQVDVYNLTMEDFQCGKLFLGNIIYSFGSECWLFIWNYFAPIIVELFSLFLIFLACNVFFTTVRKPGFLKSRKRRILRRKCFEQRPESASETEAAESSVIESTISIGMLFHRSSSGLYSSHSDVYAWKAESYEQLQCFGFKPVRRCFSTVQLRTASTTGGLPPIVRLCKSLTSLAVDNVSKGSECLHDALNISDFHLSTSRSSTFSSLSKANSSSSFNGLAMSRGKHNLFASSGSSLISSLSGSSHRQSASSGMFRLLSRSTGSALSELSDISCLLPTSGSSIWTRERSVNSDLLGSDGNSIQLSQLSQHTRWTMYKYPVPGSITSSSPHQDQLKRSEREYVFVERPYAGPLPSVLYEWLKEHFCVDSQARQVNESGEDVEFVQNGSSGSSLQESHGSNHSAQFGEPSNSNEPGSSGSSSQDPFSPLVIYSGQRDRSVGRDSCYLINNKKTDVILCGIPPAAMKISPTTWGSMTELHQPKWSPLRPYTSLPNISREFGWRNKSFEFDVKNVLIQDIETLESSSIDEKDNVLDDNMDCSISVIFEKVERRDQALRDAARAAVEQNRERQVRRLRMFREQEEMEAVRAVQLTPPSFIDVLKEEAYKQVLVPFLAQAGKEILLSVLA